MAACVQSRFRMGIRSLKRTSLDRAGQVASYRGFVFANLDGRAGSIDEHLGDAGYELRPALRNEPHRQSRSIEGFDRSMSAVKLETWPESDSDGYHVGFVHVHVGSTDTYYDDVAVGGDAAILASG